MAVLHISDIHFGINRYCKSEDEKRKYDLKQRILDDLISKLVELETDPAFKVEHIIVTGDIAWRGKKDEFDEAKEWFLKLLSSLSLTSFDITFCVGNHDIHREYAISIDESNYNGKSNVSIERIDELYSYDNILITEPLIYNYNSFCESLGVIPFKTIKKDGSIDYSYSVGFKEIMACAKSIRLFAFNTSALSDSSKYYDDRMWLGQKQILALDDNGIITSLNNPKDKNINCRIAIFHHAERYLHPSEHSEYDNRIATFPRLMKHVDLALCGHTETGGIPVLWKKIGGGQLLTGGATYYNDLHPNSFSLILLSDNVVENKIVGVKCIHQTIRYDQIKGWNKDDEKDRPPEKPLHYEEPQIRVKGKVYFITRLDDKEYSIPITGYFLKIDVEGNIVFNNFYQVDRLLDISFETGELGNSHMRISLAPNMMFSVAALLEREKYFAFVHQWIKGAMTTTIYIRNEHGKVLAQYNGLKDFDADPVSQLSLDILSRLVRIEKYFDLRFLHKQEFYEIDMQNMDTLENIIDTRQITMFNFPVIESAKLSSRESIWKVLKMAFLGKKFHLIYDGNFKVEFLGATIRFSKVKIVSPPASVLSIFDIFFKLITFRKNDSRDMRIVMDKKAKCRMYFDKIPEHDDFIKGDCIDIPQNQKGNGYSFGFIKEEIND